MPAKKKTPVTNKIGGLAVGPRKKLFVVVVLFAVIGGGFAAYKSFAATQRPPDNLLGGVGVGAVAGTDGISAQMFCNDTTSITKLGNMTPCTQIRPKTPGEGGTWIPGRTQFRFGNYNLKNIQFIPTSGWLTYAGGGDGLKTCANSGYYFAGSGNALNTTYGPVVNGQIYRRTASGWQVSWVNYSQIKGTCTDPGSWFPVRPSFVY
jgi:hypothetical protein